MGVLQEKGIGCAAVYRSKLFLTGDVFLLAWIEIG